MQNYFKKQVNKKTFPHRLYSGQYLGLPTQGAGFESRSVHNHLKMIKLLHPIGFLGKIP